MTEEDKIGVAILLMDDLIDAMERNGDGMFSQEVILEWLEKQKDIILSSTDTPGK